MSAQPTTPKLEVVETNTGHEVQYRSRQGTRPVVIDRVWTVFLDGQEIGRVEYRMVTHETRSKGKRLVNSRWRSPGYVMYPFRQAGPGVHPGYSRRGFNCPSKKKGVEWLVAEATGQAW